MEDLDYSMLMAPLMTMSSYDAKISKGLSLDSAPAKLASTHKTF